MTIRTNNNSIVHKTENMSVVGGPTIVFGLRFSSGRLPHALERNAATSSQSRQSYGGPACNQTAEQQLKEKIKRIMSEDVCVYHIAPKVWKFVFVRLFLLHCSLAEKTSHFSWAHAPTQLH